MALFLFAFFCGQRQNLTCPLYSKKHMNMRGCMFLAFALANMANNSQILGFREMDLYYVTLH